MKYYSEDQQEEKSSRGRLEVLSISFSTCRVVEVGWRYFLLISLPAEQQRQVGGSYYQYLYLQSSRGRLEVHTISTSTSRVVEVGWRYILSVPLPAEQQRQVGGTYYQYLYQQSSRGRLEVHTISQQTSRGWRYFLSVPLLAQYTDRWYVNNKSRMNNTQNILVY